MTSIRHPKLAATMEPIPKRCIHRFLKDIWTIQVKYSTLFMVLIVDLHHLTSIIVVCQSFLTDDWIVWLVIPDPFFLQTVSISQHC